MSDIESALSADVPPEFISSRQGLSYVTGRYVKQRLNELFGWNGWSYTIDEFKHATPEYPRAHCRLTLTVTDDEGIFVSRAGVAQGYGSIKDDTTADRLNQVLDFADAEAVTDALKRAAVSLGQNLGLSLYPMTPGGSRPTSSTGAGVRRKVKRR